MAVNMSMMTKYILAFFILECSLNAESIELAQFELSNGDSVTCTPILEQPSLSALHWKGATYQEAPFSTLIGVDTDEAHPDIKHAKQLFDTEAGGCPEGTIPTSRHKGFAKKFGVAPNSKNIFHKSVHSKHTTTSEPGQQPSAHGFLHEYGTAYSGGIVSRFGGAGANFNLWQPDVEDPGEFSLAQLWIMSGTYEENTLNTIEVGWQPLSPPGESYDVNKRAQVFEEHYGDKLPHLFVYWTSDAYNSTGCYNLDCPGFVQVSSNISVGGAWSTVSQTDDTQYEFRALVYKDSSQAEGDWWLQINGENVGYWPSSLFTLLNTGADKIDWGGEIINIQSKTGRHTKTDMGSGQFADAGYQKAAYIRHMQTVDLDNTLFDAPLDLNDGPTTTPGCYTAVKGTTFSDWGTYIFFGGAGYSDICLLHE